MSNENVLARWSRLKRQGHPAPDHQTETPAPPGQPAQASEPAPAAPPAGGEGLGADQDAPIADLTGLPSIEALGADSDIRAFLEAGVPTELTKAALRRVWTADPAIRDFIGLAENQWDFTDPTAVPGFGPLEEGTSVGRLVSQALGQQDLSAPTAAAREAGPSHEVAATSGQRTPKQVPGIPERKADAATHHEAIEDQQRVDLAASQHRDPPADRERPSSQRTHGRALPK
jgi:hypothetical protein